MDIGKAIYNILANDTDVSAYVDNRIFPDVARTDTTFPFIVYQVNGQTPTLDKDGPSTLDTDSVMISVYSNAYYVATAISNLVRNALDRKSGTYNTVQIQSIKYDGYNDNSYGNGVYRKALDFDIRVIRSTSEEWANTYSIDFDGVDDYLTMGDASALSFGNGTTDDACSFSFWIIVPTDDAYEDSGIICKNDSSSNRQYEILFDSSSKLRIRFWDGTAYIQSKLSSALTGVTWHHIACTYDGGASSPLQQGLNIYVDGVLVTQTRGYLGTYVASDSSTAQVTLGVRVSNSQYFEGNIDEVSIFERELSSTEVSAIYNSGTPTDLSGEGAMVGWWRMGDGATYPIIPDQSGNPNNALMINMSSSDIETEVP